MQKSRDGFHPKIFYDHCNEQGPFLVLIKGGYNPIDFASRKSQLSSDSFIISFENDQDIGRVINVKNSV